MVRGYGCEVGYAECYGWLRRWRGIGLEVGGMGLEVFRIRTATLSDAANPPDSSREACRR